MKLTRVIFLALAVLLPTSWTISQAADAPPPADAPAKKDKKSKKSKKAADTDKKTDDKAK